MPEVPAEIDMVVEDEDTGFCGVVVRVERDAVTLEDRHGLQRVFPLAPAGFRLDGAVVTLVRPTRSAAPLPTRTASGSVAVTNRRARVARASRIYVEGRHDAELVSKVWGDDLAIEGVVVEMLDGLDVLPDAVAAFRPGPGRRLGVLADHLVVGSKETRIVAGVRSPYVLVTGHPYVDIWQAVKPARLGLEQWPTIPRGLPWKETMVEHLRAPDVPTAWRRILGSVRGWTDLEPELLGPVEALIDFVTAGPSDL